MGTRHLQFWPNVPRHLTPPETSLWFNVEVSATRFPGKTCLNYYDSALTYSAFRREAERLAGFLQQACGVKRGDRVALYLQNSPQFVLAFYAILRADAMVVPINPMNLTKEVGHIVQDSGATVLFAAQDAPSMPSLSRIEPLIGARPVARDRRVLLRLPHARPPISRCRRGSRRRDSRRPAPG